MSEVNLQFTVNNFSSTITLAATELAINPQATELTVFSGFAAYPPAGGAGDTQVTFNDAGLFAGSTNFTYNKNSNTLSVDNLNTTSIISSGPLNTGTIYVTGNVYVSDTVGTGNLSVTGINDMGAVGNLRLTNTTAGQYIKTLGSNFLEIGNLAAGGQPQQLQFNDATEFGGIPTVTWDGTDLVVGDADNVKMYGGVNGYVLQTDGAGNLTWLPQAGAISPSTGAPGGANSQIQINRAGVFGGIPGFTVNPISNVMAAINLEVATVLTAGTVRTNSLAYANGIPWVFGSPAGANTTVQFNSNGSFASSNAFVFGTNPVNSVANTLSVTNVYSTGDIRGNAITAVGNINCFYTISGNLLNVNYITGNGLGITAIAAANIVGSLPAAANNQPNITSLGTLTSLTVAGTTKIQQAKEKVTIDIGSPLANTNYDALNQSVLYYTGNVTNNFILNVRGNATTTFTNIISTGESMTIVLMTSIGSTVYIPTSVTIDGATTTPMWISNVIPSTSTVFANTLVGYSYTFIKTSSSTYKVLASFTGFK